jgi:putative transcriptional regulator
MSRKIRTKEHYLGNHLLIAMPSLQDANFDHTVSLICEHNEEGAMGFVLNRPTRLPIQELLDHMDITVTVPLPPNQRLHTGGPVQPERGFVIHSPIGNWESTLELTPEIGITASRDILFAIANGEGPKKQIITLGYAGWGEGQLEREFSENSWLSVKATPELVFDTEDSALWQKSASQLGIDINSLTTQAGHA